MLKKYLLLKKKQKFLKSCKFGFGIFFNVVGMLQKTSIKDKYLPNTWELLKTYFSALFSNSGGGVWHSVVPDQPGDADA